MFDMVDTAFSDIKSIDRLLIPLFKVKESSFHEIWHADTAFLLSGAEPH